MKPQRLALLMVASLWAPLAPAQTNAALDPAMAELLRQAAVETNVFADAGFDPSVIAVGDTALYRIVVTAEPDAVKLPDNILIPSGLQVAKGGVGTSSVAKDQSSQYRATLNFRVTPRAEGSFTIPPYFVTVGGQKIAVPARTLTAVAPDSPDAKVSARLAVEVPPGDFYIGQAIPLQVVAFDPGDHSLFGLVEPKVSGDGFIFERVRGSQRRELREANGRSLSVLSEQINAIPVQEGTLTVSADAFAERRVIGDAQDVQLPGYRPFLEAPAVDLVIHHLPAGALPGFTGLIGKFSAAAARPRVREVHAGDPFDLPVVIEGEGNLARLLPPGMTNSPAWRVAPAAGNAAPTVNGNRAEFHYTLIPQIPGLTPTPAIPFSYFDPLENRYVDLTIPSITVLVLPPAAGRAKPEATASANAATALPAGLGIMAPQPVHFAVTLTPWQQRPVFWCWQLGLTGTLAIWYGWQRRRDFLAAHPELVKLAAARRDLRQWDRRRQRAFRARDAAEFVRAAVASLRVASAAGSRANPEALVGDDVIEALAPADQTAGHKKLVRDIFRQADALAYQAEAPNGEELWRQQPEIEALLAVIRRARC
jgi:hypothetical protein